MSARSIARTLVIPALLLVLVRPSPAGPEPPSAPEGRFEQAWSVVAGLGDGEGVSRTRSGLVRLQRLVGLATALRTGRAYDEPTRRLRQAIRGGMATLDVRGIYELLAEHGTESDGTRRARFLGRRLGERYLISRPEEGAGPRPDDLGDLRASLSFRPGWDGYVIGFQGQLHLGRVRLPHLAALWGRVLGYLDRAPRAEPPARREPRGPEGDADQAVIAGFRSAFPNAYAFIRPFIRAEALVAEPGEDHVRYRVRLLLDVEGLAEDWPLLAGRLEEIRGLVRTTVRIRDDEGHRVGRTSFDSDRFALESTFVVGRGGRFLPFGPDGRPVPDHPGWDPVETTRFDGTVEGEVHLDVSGLRMDIEGWETEIAYRRGPDGAGLFATRFHRPPRVDVHGAALGVVPPWLIDVLIPGSLESIAREFLETLATGDNGRGLWSRLEMPGLEGRGPEALYRFRGAGELRSNGFVSFLLKVARWRLLLGGEERDELGAFREAFWSAVTRDVEEAASYYGASAY